MMEVCFHLVHGLANQAWRGGGDEENAYALYRDTLEVLKYSTVSYIQIEKKF
jgi:hypothetical protein